MTVDAVYLLFSFGWLIHQYWRHQDIMYDFRSQIKGSRSRSDEVFFRVQFNFDVYRAAVIDMLAKRLLYVYLHSATRLLPAFGSCFFDARNVLEVG